jgi:hypothetical protein
LTITLTNVQLTTINGSAITPVAASLGNTTINVTSTTFQSGVYVYTATLSTNKTFGTGGSGSEAILAYNVSSGYAQGSASSFSGDVTGVSSNNLAGYDFSPFNNGGGVVLTFNSSGSDIGAIIQSGGVIPTSGTATGTFSESASIAPEPSTMAIFGIGLAGLLAVRRYYKRPAVA